MAMWRPAEVIRPYPAATSSLPRGT
jgi:hypothetical protein